MARPNMKPVAGPFVAPPEPPEEEEEMLMGRADFTAGVPEIISVTDFGVTPVPVNFLPPGPIQSNADVEGAIHGNTVPGAFGNVLLRGADALLPGDIVTPDPALGGVVAGSYSAPGPGAARTIDLDYDGGDPPPGEVSVVRANWKGTDILIFLEFAVE